MPQHRSSSSDPHWRCIWAQLAEHTLQSWCVCLQKVTAQAHERHNGQKLCVLLVGHSWASSIQKHNRGETSSTELVRCSPLQPMSWYKHDSVTCPSSRMPIDNSQQTAAVLDCSIKAGIFLYFATLMGCHMWPITSCPLELCSRQQQGRTPLKWQGSYSAI